MNKRGQGAVEYIIILGVIILIALIVVSSLGGLGIFDFSAQAQTRSTEISNLLSDVGFQYVLKNTGAVQVAIKSNTNKQILAHNMTWLDMNANVLCQINMTETTVRQNFVTFGNSTCTGLSGTSGDSYSFDCVMRYRDANGVEHAVQGACDGIYEQ